MPLQPLFQKLPDFNNLRRPLLAAGLIYFSFTFLAGLVLQTIVLPYLFPSLNAGEGLLAGTDAFGFHKIALALAKMIHENGWSAWELRPNGQAPAGIAAIFYVLITPHPYVMLPLNALMHALAGVVLMRICLYLDNDKNFAFIAALPFIVFPSAMTWYAQIHKDGFYLAGLYLCVLGWTMLARLETWTGSWKRVAIALLPWFSGLLIAGTVRIYAFQLMQAIGYVLAVGLSILFVIRSLKGNLKWPYAAIATLLLFAMPLGLRYAPKEIRTNAKIVQTTPTPTTVGGGDQTQPNFNPDEPRWLGTIVAEQHWVRTPGVPEIIENNFLRIGVLREGYLTTPDYRNAGSMIDFDVHLYSIGDFFSYLPRASLIGLAAPFPSDWVAQGSSPGGSAMRKISGFEMTYTYLALAFLPLALWRWRKRVEMWVPLVFGGVFIFIYAYATPNLGSLYRLRYGFLMLPVCLGTLCALHLSVLFFSREKKTLK